MRRKLLPLLGIAICFVATNCFAQGLPAPKSDTPNANQQEQVKTIFFFLKDEIGLTDDQETKLKALLYDEQTSLNTDNDTLKTLRNRA